MAPRKKHQNSPPPDEPNETANASTAVQELVELLRDGIANSLSESRWRPKEPPTFAGDLHEQPDKFIERIEAHFQTNSVPKDQYVPIAKTCLTGRAARWFKPFTNLDMPWRLFTERFLEEFESPEARTKLHITLLTDPQGSNESGRDFVARKMTLAQRCSEASLSDILESTISLLRQEYRFSLALHEIKDFNTLLDLVTLLDRRNSPRTSQSSNSASARRPPAQSSPTTHQTPPVHTPSRNTTERPPPYPCRTCNGNHWMRDCPTNVARARPTQRAEPTQNTRTNEKPSTSNSSNPSKNEANVERTSRR